MQEVLDYIKAAPIEMARVMDSLGMKAVVDFSPAQMRAAYNDDWSVKRIKAIDECGIPLTARLWLDVRPLNREYACVGNDLDINSKGNGALLRFEWCLEWHPEPSLPSDRLMFAKGRGDTDDEAFSNLIRALS